MRQEPSHSEIALSAYEIWEIEGKPHGRAKEHWNAAMEKLRRDYLTRALRPDRYIHKTLISSPSHFVGEYSGEFLLTHAWGGLTRQTAEFSMDPNSPLHRTFLVYAFEGDTEYDRAPANFRILPDYNWMSDAVCVFLSLFYGKRFDEHGLIESNGHYLVPIAFNLRPKSQLNSSITSSAPRKDLGYELNLSKVQLLAPIFTGKTSTEATTFIYTAAKFYLQALRMIDTQPEQAYINLISAGEIISNAFTFSDARLYDEQILALLLEIRDALGAKQANLIRQRLFQVKRRFTAAIEDLITAVFFEGSESTYHFAALSADRLHSSLRSAYDLRSYYVHTGQAFGGWIVPDASIKNDLQIGTPVVDNNDFKKILISAPTFTGLERIIRFALLSYLHRRVTPIDGRLDAAIDPAPG